MKPQAENHTILPESCFIIAVNWDTDQEITPALQEIPASTQCPPDKSYVPSNHCDALISRVHTPTNHSASRCYQINK